MAERHIREKELNMKTITVDFVRHGQTIFNTMNKLQGWADSPLTSAGIATADAVGQRLKNVTYQAAYASDLKRAMDTATHILHASSFDGPLQTDKSFREVFFGSYEGLDNDEVWSEVGRPLECQTQAEIIKKYSFDRARDAMHNADPRHLSEDGETFKQRIDDGLQKLVTTCDDQARVLVVTHGTLIRSLVLRYGQDFDALSKFPVNGGVTTLKITSMENGFSAKVTSYNVLD